MKQTHKLDDQSRAKVVEMWKAGHSCKEIQKALGVSGPTVYYILDKFGIERKQTHHTTPQEREQVLALRKLGRKLEDIAQQTGLTVSNVKLIIEQSDVRLTKEQKSANMCEVGHDVKAQIVALRKTGMPIKEVAQKCGVKVSMVKTVLTQNRVVLPLEVREMNAHKARLQKNPDHMNDMRGHLTSEVRKRQGESLASFYASNPEARASMSTRITYWWANISEEYRNAFIQNRRAKCGASEVVRAYQSSLSGEGNPNHAAMLARFGVQTIDELLNKLALENQGKYLGGWDGNLMRKCEWMCSKDHTFSMRPRMCFGASNGALSAAVPNPGLNRKSTSSS